MLGVQLAVCRDSRCCDRPTVQTLENTRQHTKSNSVRLIGQIAEKPSAVYLKDKYKVTPVPKHHVTNTYVEVGVIFHAFLTSALAGYEWQASHSDSFTELSRRI
jgi:hypothetical protein